LIPLSLLIVLPVVSSAVFSLGAPSLIAGGSGSSFQLLSRGFSFRHDGGEGGRWKREKEGEGRRRSGKARVANRTAGMMEWASTPLSIGAQNSVKKEPILGPIDRAFTHPLLTLLVRYECLKQHGVGEREGGYLTSSTAQI